MPVSTIIWLVYIKTDLSFSPSRCPAINSFRTVNRFPTKHFTAVRNLLNINIGLTTNLKRKIYIFYFKGKSFFPGLFNTVYCVFNIRN